MTKIPARDTSRVLIVDDEPIISVTAADCLRREGFEVTATPSASVAVEFVRQGVFSMAIIDLPAPALNGIESAAIFAQLHQPFMFLSAISDEALVSAAISAGALAYVVKPVDPIRLIPTIRAAISRAREIAALVKHNEQLTRTIDSSRDVNVAVGLLMSHRGVPRQTAYDMLRQHARRTRRRLADLASEVTAGAEALFKVPAFNVAEHRTSQTCVDPEDAAN